jgi:hypothetical protein
MRSNDSQPSSMEQYRCVHCGYILHLVPADGRCSECGMLSSSSYAFALNSALNHDYFKTLSRYLIFALMGCIFMATLAMSTVEHALRRNEVIISPYPLASSEPLGLCFSSWLSFGIATALSHRWLLEMDGIGRRLNFLYWTLYILAPVLVLADFNSTSWWSTPSLRIGLSILIFVSILIEVFVNWKSIRLAAHVGNLEIGWIFNCFASIMILWYPVLLIEAWIEISPLFPSLGQTEILGTPRHYTYWLTTSLAAAASLVTVATSIVIIRLLIPLRASVRTAPKQNRSND